MAHQAETILAAIVTILKAGSTTDAGQAVYRGRTLPVEAAENSATGDVINVFEGDETSSLRDLNVPGGKLRTLQVFVELHKRASSTDQNDPSIDTLMNEFLRKVEVALEASFTLGGVCDKFVHTATQRARDGASQEFRVVTLELQVSYSTQRTNPAIRV
jgi:hypothetical protein